MENFTRKFWNWLRPVKNAVYDPMFETMGLPVDPHLRMFVTRHNNGISQFNLAHFHQTCIY